MREGQLTAYTQQRQWSAPRRTPCRRAAGLCPHVSRWMLWQLAAGPQPPPASRTCPRVGHIAEPLPPKPVGIRIAGAHGGSILLHSEQQGMQGCGCKNRPGGRRRRRPWRLRPVETARLVQHARRQAGSKHAAGQEACMPLSRRHACHRAGSDEDYARRTLACWCSRSVPGWAGYTVTQLTLLFTPQPATSHRRAKAPASPAALRAA